MGREAKQMIAWMALERLHCLAYGGHECRWRYDLWMLDERERMDKT